MSATLKVSDLPKTLKATFLDADGDVDTTGTVSWSFNGNLTPIDNHDGTCTIAKTIGMGSVQVSATNTDTDGASLTIGPFGLTITSGDAATGTIEVV